ncbi:tRNA pseudouridine(55) synthase TruB [bacterium]|nr:tRNA pseudouridine(55) synthase TruB [bacterium]
MNKPVDWTSHDVVAFVRKRYKYKKVGHSGTIDPFGTGLLLLCVGPATKLAPFLADLPKRYSVTAKLGVVTDTYDRTGQIVAQNPVGPEVGPKIRDALMAFVGEHDQVPPMFSAIKYQGKPLYELARQGVKLDLPARRIKIYEIVPGDIQPPFFSFDVLCGPGMYVRSLVHDLGQELGCGATVDALTRVQIGDLTLDRAAGPKELPEQPVLLAPDQLLSSWPKLPLGELEAGFVAGHPISLSVLFDRPSVDSGQMIFGVGRSGLCGFGEVRGGKIYPKGSFV